MGSLRSLTVQPATKKRYTAAVDKFLQFLNREGLVLPDSRDKLDILTAEYMEFLWQSGEGRALASDTLAGLQDQDPRLKGRLVCTWRLLKVWHTHEVPNRAPPIPERVLYGGILSLSQQAPLCSESFGGLLRYDAYGGGHWPPAISGGSYLG